MTDKITDISAAAGADILSADKTGVPAADRSAAAIQAQPSDGLTTVKEQQLGGGMTVFTNDIHTFGTDAVLLASFAQPRKSTKAVELGTGCGIISLLNTGGRLCMCQRPSRLCDLMVSMRNHGIEPKRLRMVEQRQGASPNLFLIEGKKGAKSGIIIEKPLVIEDEKGEFSEEIKQIYGKYYAMKEANARKGRV